MRSAYIERKTKETDIKMRISLDIATNEQQVAAADERPKGIETGCGFLNHMLTLFAFHSGISLAIEASGDTDVDYHHLTEDVGIVLGMCLKEALGGGKGVNRYGSVFLPMDETLVLAALDISGRAHLNFDVQIGAPKVGDFDTELCEEFLGGLCRALGLTLHVKLFYGRNAHHIIEAVFKGLGRALGEAVRIDPSKSGVIPSSKGSL